MNEENDKQEKDPEVDGAPEEELSESEEMKDEKEPDDSVVSIDWGKLIEEAEERGKAQGREEARAEIEVLLAEAEEKGYIRGKNEKIEIVMDAIRSGEAAAEASREAEMRDLPILRRLRKSRWNNT